MVQHMSSTVRTSSEFALQDGLYEATNAMRSALLDVVSAVPWRRQQRAQIADLLRSLAAGKPPAADSSSAEPTSAALQAVADATAVMQAVVQHMQNSDEADAGADDTHAQQDPTGNIAVAGNQGNNRLVQPAANSNDTGDGDDLSSVQPRDSTRQADAMAAELSAAQANNAELSARVRQLEADAEARTDSLREAHAHNADAGSQRAAAEQLDDAAVVTQELRKELRRAHEECAAANERADTQAHAAAAAQERVQSLTEECAHLRQEVRRSPARKTNSVLRSASSSPSRVRRACA